MFIFVIKMRTIDRDDLKLHEIDREIKIREKLQEQLSSGTLHESRIRKELEKLYRMRHNYIVQHSPKNNDGGLVA